MKFKDWPNCPTPDCQFKVCVWARTGLCAKCSDAMLGNAEMDRRYDETHTDGALNEDVEGVESPEEAR